MNGKVGSFTRNEERARVAGHDPVIQSGQLKANDGIYPTGLLLSRNGSGELIPLTVVDNEILATGTGAVKAYPALALASFPVEPGTFTATDSVETFSDDGCGRVVGSATGTGTINYKTGKVALTFTANVGNTTPITADYTTAVAGILDEETDTSLSGSGIYVAHGTVNSTVLKVGKITQAAPAFATLMLLQHKGIYPK